MSHVLYKTMFSSSVTTWTLWRHPKIKLKLELRCKKRPNAPPQVLRESSNHYPRVAVKLLKNERQYHFRAITA